MRLYPECLDASLRDELLAHQTFYEPSQFAFLLEAFLEHFLQRHSMDLLEVTLDPVFGQRLRSSLVDPEAICSKVITQLSNKQGRKIRAYIHERPGAGLGLEEIGLGPGDWRKAADSPLEGDLVVHFLENDRIIYSRPFEEEITFVAGKVVRSRFLGRVLLRRYGELYVIFQDAVDPVLLKSLNEMELRISQDRESRLHIEIEPANRYEKLRMGERVSLLQTGPAQSLSLIVTPRNQEPKAPLLESFWIGLHPSGHIEAQAAVREPFEIQEGQLKAFLTLHQENQAAQSFILEKLARRETVQIFRGKLQFKKPPEQGMAVDIRLVASNRSGFKLDTGSVLAESNQLRPLLLPQALSAPAFMTPGAVERGFSLAFTVGDGGLSGKKFTLYWQRGPEMGQVGPSICRASRVTFELPPLEPDTQDWPLAFWIECDDPSVPLAYAGNNAKQPLLRIPVYPIAPGGRPILGDENFLFPDEVLHFGPEKLRLLPWQLAWPTKFPSPEHYPYVLWRAQDRPHYRFFLRDGHFSTEGASVIEQLILRAGFGDPELTGPREMSLPLQCSGRDAYLALRGHESGGVLVRKAAGRIHDVALNFEPLGASTHIPLGRNILVAGSALLGVQIDHESIELALLGHTLLDEELAAGIQVTSDAEVAASSRSWIYLHADRPMTLTLLYP